MLQLLPARAIRRPVLVASILICAIFMANFFKKIASLHPVHVDFTPRPHETVTVTRVQTECAQETRASLPGAIDKHSRQQNHLSKTEPLQKHRYRSDGLLEVNPDGPHPIFELIRNAEEKWNAKLSRSSRTLAEAVTEYQRRYKRPPPTGFDKWWDYVERHNVQLPDEYDQIFRDLQPYWGMNPKDLQQIETEWEAHADSYTIGKTTGEPIKLVNYSLPGNEHSQFDLAGGAFQIMELLEDVEEFIPPFRAIFTPHDNPTLHTDFELQTQALKHAAAGTFLDMNNPPPVKLNGWIAACDPASPARATPFDWEAPVPPRTTKTFIHTHRDVMDPCLHPDLLRQHGQFISHRTGPVPHRRMIPQFSYSPTIIHHDIVVAMPINWISDLSRGDDPAWADKFDSRLQWRGTSTGVWHAPGTHWRDAQRGRLIEWANHGLEGNWSVLLPTEDASVNVGEPVQIKKARYAPPSLDIWFAGKPANCPPEFCEEVARFFEFRQQHDFKRAGNYKYILDVDGNGWSSRFKRLITSNSLIFKSTIYPEWFTDRIAPWVHYIPVQNDYSDLYDSLLFFRGDLDGRNAHDDLAEKIATAGREWSLRFWRKEDLTAYMFR
ncbi:hypothetical protein H0H81_010283 [Sphagnurus paluster]|uniref:Glycosyl transferase CAP10 domain-containing protein n=1 Tax=Sphagnurus paluster TaxID=117069 RepID=A0A9P7GUV5_9AGAR|nr:hypothetical protein H0H81_010283 [Sphagnurus paluster]